jgi:prepilin-type N-terminal cleavage/methylation domain-containing protein
MTSKIIIYIKSPRSGFTLVEIMVVVVIIGLLAAMAIPAFQKVRLNSYASRIANDFRIFAGSFEIHALEVGAWPEDGNGNSLPASAEPYFEGTAWYSPAPNGGNWDWELNRFGFLASIALTDGGGSSDSALYTRVDDILDDGNLSTGSFRQVSGRYLYILEE